MGNPKAISLLCGRLGQRGRVVRALNLKSVARGFKSRFDHQTTGVVCARALTTDYIHSKFNTFFVLLYIELSNSFLIGRKRTVNFRNQRPWDHNCRLYSNRVKDTQGHGLSCQVRALCVGYRQWSRNQRHDFHFFRSMYNKAITTLGLCGMQNNQGTQLWLITLTSTLIILDITKTSCYNWLSLYWFTFVTWRFF